jgi:hypothetical protein
MKGFGVKVGGGFSDGSPRVVGRRRRQGEEQLRLEGRRRERRDKASRSSAGRRRRTRVSIGTMADALLSDDAASALADVLARTKRVGRVSTRVKNLRKQLRRETRVGVPGHHRGKSVQMPFKLLSSERSGGARKLKASASRRALSSIGFLVPGAATKNARRSAGTTLTLFPTEETLRWCRSTDGSSFRGLNS